MHTFELTVDSDDCRHVDGVRVRAWMDADMEASLSSETELSLVRKSGTRRSTTFTLRRLHFVDNRAVRHDAQCRAFQALPLGMSHSPSALPGRLDVLVIVVPVLASAP